MEMDKTILEMATKAQQASDAVNLTLGALRDTIDERHQNNKEAVKEQKAAHEAMRLEINKQSRFISERLTPLVTSLSTMVTAQIKYLQCNTSASNFTWRDAAMAIGAVAFVLFQLFVQGK